MREERGVMRMIQKLPVGVDDFEKLRQEDFYYIDKTGLIQDLLSSWTEVTLFTRPRRFGKTLNMSMLKCFFEIGTDPSLFDGLKISRNKELCEKYMGKFPVLFVTLKDVDGLAYKDALFRLKYVVREEAMRHAYLKKSDKLSEEEKQQFVRMMSEDYEDVKGSFRTLCKLLYQHHGQKTIVLIDEYDVPLAKAFQQGYYREMVASIRSFLSQILKSNPYLQFAVLTGCLRVSKESIFTGLNNLEVNSIVDESHEEYFGFTEVEVQKILKDYDFEDKADLIKEWYDGYRFGNVDVYCPWDVIKYVKKLLVNRNAQPEAFWINTSGNDMVKRFIDKSDKTTQLEIERLIAGEAIEKKLRLDLTYDELDTTIDNLWSVLFTTGYLTQEGSSDGRNFKLIIPNKEVEEVFVLQIQEWFRETTRSDLDRINRFCAAFPVQDVKTIQEMLNDYLWDSISIRDTAVRKYMKESFYHGLLLGLLRSQERWLIRSNAETGEGYSDISVCTPARLGIIIEIKYAEDGNLEAACEKALRQIEEKKYTEGLRREGMKKTISYGIAFHEKECMVMCKGQTSEN